MFNLKKFAASPFDFKRNFNEMDKEERDRLTGEWETTSIIITRLDKNLSAKPISDGIIDHNIREIIPVGKYSIQAETDEYTIIVNKNNGQTYLIENYVLKNAENSGVVIDNRHDLKEEISKKNIFNLSKFAIGPFEFGRDWDEIEEEEADRLSGEWETAHIIVTRLDSKLIATLVLNGQRVKEMLPMGKYKVIDYDTYSTGLVNMNTLQKYVINNQLLAESEKSGIILDMRHELEQEAKCFNLKKLAASPDDINWDNRDDEVIGGEFNSFDYDCLVEFNDPDLVAFNPYENSNFILEKGRKFRIKNFGPSWGKLNLVDEKGRETFISKEVFKLAVKKGSVVIFCDEEKYASRKKF